MLCTQCGSAIPEQARFCPACGSSIEAVPATSERRRLVTVLFADIAGSTAMGERLDPEAVRALLARHFSAIRAIIERHGGTVEKFIGDAVMAVFGIPVAHEDDALRAARAAREMQDAIGRLNDEPGAVARVAVRIGLNSGEVVAADGAADTLVTGDTVNTAARLEQAAEPGEILIGDATYRLVEDAVAVERHEPIAAKGKAEPVPAYQLLAVVGFEGRRRHLEARLVGREGELAALRGAWRDVSSGLGARLVTVVAPAGVGKSRLVRELVDEIRQTGVSVLTSRCLPYGDGITYWPIRALLLEAAGVKESDPPDAARQKLAAVLGKQPDAAAVGAAVASAIGLSSQSAAQDEVFWSVRRALETISASPLLVVIDDLHWAEPTLLDLLAYLVDLIATPILFVGTARPELLELRPEWQGMGAATSLLRLEALAESDTAALLDAQAGGGALPRDMKRRILEAAEGNPLFIEEMMAMLREDERIVPSGNEWHAVPGSLAEVEVPTTIRALLSARLDRLPADERVITERAAVVGRSFEAAALAELTPDGLRGELRRRLVALVHKELLHADRSDIVPGDAFRFRHVLIRDAAYEMLPKADRADLHERFAAWLGRVSGDRLPEFEEILGYHLEQAANYHRELGNVEDAERMGRRAGIHLYAAGERAARRGDNGAVIPLMTKAALLLSGPQQAEARLDLAVALSGAGEHAEAIDECRAVAEWAVANGDETLRDRVRIYELSLQLNAPDYPAPMVRRELRAAVQRLDGTELHRDLAWAWVGIGMTVANDRVEETRAFEHAIDHALRVGDWRIASAAVANLASSLVTGPTPAAEALSALEVLASRAAASRRAQAGILSARGMLLAMRGDFAEARNVSDQAIDLCRQMRLVGWEIITLGQRTEIDLLAGDAAAALAASDAAQLLVEGLAPMRRWYLGDRLLVLLALGEGAEALAVADALLTDEDDDADVIVKALLGRARAHHLLGNLGPARAAADAAIAALEAGEFLPYLAGAHAERGSVRKDADDPLYTDDLDRAEAAFERKGHSVGLAWVQQLRGT